MLCPGTLLTVSGQGLIIYTITVMEKIMKKISAFVLSFIILIPVTGFTGPIQDGVKDWIELFGRYYSSGGSTIQADTPSGGNAEFSIKERELYINGQRIQSPWDLKTVLNSIGRYDRVANLANNIYTYDSMGILVYETPGSSKVNEINLGWVKENYDFSAKVTFSGTFMIDNIRYDNSVTIDQVRKNLARYKIEKAYGDSYRVSLSGIYIYFNYDPQTMKITYVAFGPEK